uniref:Putative serine protease n=1 Tax=Ixodes ricinus TaxID=34613 RepID=A0A0K8RIW0_IXORI
MGFAAILLYELCDVHVGQRVVMAWTRFAAFDVLGLAFVHMVSCRAKLRALWTLVRIVVVLGSRADIVVLGFPTYHYRLRLPVRQYLSAALKTSPFTPPPSYVVVGRSVSSTFN